jgi:hypothetical protein
VPICLPNEQRPYAEKEDGRRERGAGERGRARERARARARARESVCAGQMLCSVIREPGLKIKPTYTGSV